MSLAVLRRGVVAASLIVAPGLSLASTLLAPPWPDDPDGYVRILAESSRAAVSMQLFLIAQAFWLIGLVGVGHAASRRSPAPGLLGAALAGLGTFGHVVAGAVPLGQLPLAQAAVENGDVGGAAAVIQAAQSGPLVPYEAIGLIGTVAGCAVLVVAGVRAGIAPWWVPALMLVSLVSEFGLSGWASWGEDASAALVLVAFASLGVWIFRDVPDTWRTATEAQAEAGAEAGVRSVAH